MGSMEDTEESAYKWTPDLSVGIDALDDDHKGFFEMADQLRDAVGRPEPDPMTVESILLVLDEYVTGHFWREENALKKGPHLEYVAHKREHDKFKTRYNSITTLYYDGRREAIRELPELVCSWIVEHIRRTDRRYAAWLKATDVDRRPLALLVSAQDMD